MLASLPKNILNVDKLLNDDKLAKTHSALADGPLWCATSVSSNVSLPDADTIILS